MSTTIRHVGIAVGLIISGAMERAEYDPDMTEEEYNDEILLAVVREVAGWADAPDGVKERVEKLTEPLNLILESLEVQKD